jgi:hypothetical protein
MKRWYKEREQLFLLRKLTDISEPNTICDDNSIQFNSILYFNVLTQQLQEPITESAQEDT